MLDWRHLPEDIERFDVVIASDVLYERPYGEIVARTIAATMRENGRAVVADPGRVGRESFLDALSANGLALRSYNDIPYADGSIRQTIRLLDVVRTY